MLIGHRDDLAVVGGDLVQVRGALEERGTLRRGQPRAVLGQRQDDDRLPGHGESVDALVTPLERQPYPRVPGNAASCRKHQPDRPLWVTGARGAFGAAGDLVDAPAPVAPHVRLAVTRVIRGQLLGARPGVFLVGFGLVPPAELREIQGVVFGQPPGLDLTGPVFVTLGEVDLRGHATPPRMGQDEGP